MGTQPPPQKGGGARSPILRVEVENFEIGPEGGALPVIANFVALEQQILLVKPGVNRFRNSGDISDRNFALYASLGIYGV